MQQETCHEPVGTATPHQFTVVSHMCSAEYLLEPVLAFAGELGPGTRVLDVGCGNGSWSAEFAKRGCTVVGIDPSPTGVDIARSTTPSARFEVMDVSPTILATLGESPFDIIISTEVIEHLYSPHALATGCMHALRPGGTVVLSTPYHGWLKNVALAASGKLDLHYNALGEGGHIKFFSRRVLCSLLADTGFENIRFAGAGRVPFLWKSMVLAATKPS